jgi:hypothetical protein
MKLWNEMSLLEQYTCIYSDMHKDAYGFRPRNDISEWTEDDFRKEFEILQKCIIETEDDIW